jgi:hypothetical protein
MDHSPSKQSPSDRSTEGECSKQQIIHPINEIQTSFEELRVQETSHFGKSNTMILV